MNLSNPADARNRGRFWLALSLSSVTALAVTVPLAFRAADAGQQSEDPATSEITVPPTVVEPVPTEDSVVAESEPAPTTSSILTIEMRGDVDTELVFESGDPEKITTSSVPPTTAATTSTTIATTEPAAGNPDESTSPTEVDGSSGADSGNGDSGE